MIMQRNQNRPVKSNVTVDYLIRLGNGLGWLLSSTRGVKLEVRRLARLMGLEPCALEEYPKLVFIRGGQGKRSYEQIINRGVKKTGDNLRCSGWQAYDLGVCRLWHHNDTPDLICEMKHDENVYAENILSMRLSLYPIYQQVLETGGLPLHAGLVEHRGKGILLAAPRNTGKSTGCRRLPSSWHCLCDEEALIVRHAERRYLVHPLPTWSDYFEKRSNQTWKVNNHLPLTSIFLLEKSTEDEVIPLGQGEATAFVNQLALQMCYRYWADLDPKDMRSRRTQLLENICELAGAVPAFKLRVSLSGRFWEKIEAVLP